MPIEQVANSPEVLRIRQAQLNRVLSAIDEISPTLAEDVREAVTRISQSGWSKRRIRREVRRLYEIYSNRLDTLLIDLVRDSSLYGHDYADAVARSGLENARPIAASKVNWALQAGEGTTKAVVAYIKRRGLLAQKSLARSLSTKLHTLTTREVTEVSRQIIKAIQSGESLGFTSRKLLEVSKGFAQDYRKLPKLAREFVERVKTLDNTLQVVSSKEMKSLQRYTKRLVEGGRVQSGYLELVQDLTKYGPTQKTIDVTRTLRDGRRITYKRKITAPSKRMERAISKWMHHKQRYAGERLLRTESQLAFREAQLGRDEQKPWIIGYRWVMNSGVHGRFVKRRPGRLRKLGTFRSGKRKGRGKYHCICETMSGRVLSKEEAKRWTQGGHPNCACTLVPVYDEKRMLQAPITSEEREWIRDEFG